MIHCWFFCTPQRGGSVFFHDICDFFVCIADCVCGITTKDPGKVMNSMKDKLADEERELLEDEDPFSCV